MPSVTASKPNRESVLGTQVDLLTRRQTVDRILSAIAERRQIQHCVVNVAKLVTMQTDANLKSDVEASDIVNIDGMGVVWGARMLGVDVPERVAGIDLFQDLLAACAQHGLRPYLLGARQDVLENAVDAIRRAHPAIEIAGWRNGYFTQADEAAVAAQIRACRADMLFVAISSPIKERFIAKYRDDLGVPFLMGVGGSFDVIGGHVRRAPRWMQDYGLEWLYRVIQEPRRMWKRYLLTNVKFAALLLRELAKRGLRRTRARSATTGG